MLVYFVACVILGFPFYAFHVLNSLCSLFYLHMHLIFSNIGKCVSYRKVESVQNKAFFLHTFIHG